jgi:hypothetical protein
LTIGLAIEKCQRILVIKNNFFYFLIKFECLTQKVNILSSIFDNQKIPYTLLHILNNGAHPNGLNSNEKFQSAFKPSMNVIKEISDWIDKNCQQIFLKKLLEDTTLRKKSNSGLHGVWGVPGRK